MKEHPDYKYRPRRKPKPLLKKDLGRYPFPFPFMSNPGLDPMNPLARQLLSGIFVLFLIKNNYDIIQQIVATKIFKNFGSHLRTLIRTELRKRSSKILEEHSVKSFIEFGNLYQLSTTQGQDPVSINPPQTN